MQLYPKCKIQEIRLKLLISNLAFDLNDCPAILLSLFIFMKRSFPGTSILFAVWSLLQSMQYSLKSPSLNIYILLSINSL